MNQTEEHCRISRIYPNNERADRAAAGVAPNGAKSRAGAVRLRFNTVTGESGAVPRQGQGAAAVGRSKNW